MRAAAAFDRGAIIHLKGRGYLVIGSDELLDITREE
jgi:hypothetical protein